MHNVFVKPQFREIINSENGRNKKIAVQLPSAHGLLVLQEERSAGQWRIAIWLIS